MRDSFPQFSILDGYLADGFTVYAAESIEPERIQAAGRYPAVGENDDFIQVITDE